MKPGADQQRVVLLGGGGHASDILSVVEASARHAAGPGVGTANVVEVFVADETWERPERFAERSTRRISVQLIESIEAGVEMGPHVVAVGYPDGRRRLATRADAAGGLVSSPIIHPTADIGFGVELCNGVVVMGQAWLSPMVRLGRHCHVGYGVTIGHDTEIGTFGSIMPGACIGGDVTIGDGALIGANATVLQGITIGEGALVGAGAVVIADVVPNETVVGVPAATRRCKTRSGTAA